MILEKDVIVPNGVLTTVHKLMNIKLNAEQTALEAQVGSWVSLSNLVSGVAPIWNHYIEVPTHGIITAIYNDLTAVDTFAGGTILPTSTTPLDIPRTYKWNELKLERSRREYSGFTWDGSTFDSDPQSQSRVQGGVQLAIMAQQANQPFSINWTLKDNSVRTLSGQDMIGVGQALAAHIQALHETSRALRQQLDNATSVQAIEAIQWPV